MAETIKVTFDHKGDGFAMHTLTGDVYVREGISKR